MILCYSDPNNKQHVSSILQKCQDDTRCTAYKKVKAGLHPDIVITIAEHACDHVLKRVLKLSAYRFQIFFVKYEYLRSLQLLTKAYGGSLKKHACNPYNLYGDQALKRYTRRLQQLKERKLTSKSDSIKRGCNLNVETVTALVFRQCELSNIK